MEENKVNKLPSHPGPEMREFFLTRKGLNMEQLAKKIKVSRQAMDKIFNGQGRLTVMIARRMEIAFKDNLEGYLSKQLKYDLYQERLKVSKL